jgi:hypothetical protein
MNQRVTALMPMKGHSRARTWDAYGDDRFLCPGAFRTRWQPHVD